MTKASASAAEPLLESSAKAPERQVSAGYRQVSGYSSASLEGLDAAPKKTRIWWGYLPMWSETFPLHAATGRIDWAGVVVNVGSGLIMGCRESLGCIVSASLIFSSGEHHEIIAMLPWGIKNMLYTSSMSVLWYGIFGRLQYSYATQQDLICILQAEMANQIAMALKRVGKPEMIPATVIAAIALSSVLSGLCCLVLGKLGLGSYMFLFPRPVINGFLGAIGVVVVRAAMQTASGVKFRYFYPTDWQVFLRPNRLCEVACMVAMVFCIRLGPGFLESCFPKNNNVKRLGGLACQLIPLAVFWILIALTGVTHETLEEKGWVYPQNGNSDPFSMWSTYNIADVDTATLSRVLTEMPSLMLMVAICTMMGVLAITDAFRCGPDGDPAPMDNIDFDTELCTVGASSVLIGCTGGNLNFHKFSAIQLRLDGGSHRISVFMIAAFSGGLFWSGIPIGSVIPRWFLAGLFMNTGVHFLKGTFLSYRTMPTFIWRGWNLPSPQYIIAPSTVIVAVFYTPATAILVGLLLSIAIFLVISSNTSPVSNVVIGDHVMSRSKRPFWEMRVLRREGDRIVLLYLQGQLFFGSARKLVAALQAAAASDRVRFCILSFARVPVVDTTAARHLKTAAERLKQRRVQVICCRMNKDVYNALSTVGLVEAPDHDLLKHLQNLRWKTTPMPSKRPKKIPTRVRTSLTANASNDDYMLSPKPAFVAPFSSPRIRTFINPDNVSHLSPLAPLCLESQTWGMESKTPPSSGIASPVLTQSPVPNAKEQNQGPSDPDAFAHETDALDYCDERLIAKYCYSDENYSELEPFMRTYRATYMSGGRLPDWTFEAMNNLPRGLMAELRCFCTVYDDVPAWTKMSDTMGVEGALCFILKGSISVIQMVQLSDDVSVIDPEVHGFSFREGKRLLKRYPPGHVAGKNGFFLKYSDQVIDNDVIPKMVVSSKLGPPAEIWVMQPEQWDQLPMRVERPDGTSVEMKGPLTEMLCVQFADDEQHTRFQER